MKPPPTLKQTKVASRQQTQEASIYSFAAYSVQGRRRLEPLPLAEYSVHAEVS